MYASTLPKSLQVGETILELVCHFLRRSLSESFRASKEIHTDSEFIRHTLEVNDVLISGALLGKASPNYYLYRFDHERTLQRKPCVLTWQGRQRKLIPDGLLDFRMVLEGGTERRRVVLLEHDCGTEYQSAFRKRIRSYIVMLRTNAHQEHFGARTVTVAFTTFEGEKRLADMRRWTVEELKSTNEPSSVGLNFFFTNQLKPPDTHHLWLEPCWYTPPYGDLGSVSMETDGQALEPERTQAQDTPVAPYEFLYITRAYNRKEITLEEWRRLTKEWAERMIKQYGEGR